MTARASQTAVQTAVVGDPQVRLGQGAVQVAVTLTPQNSPATLDQAVVQVAVRRKHRRLVITTD